MSGDDLHRAAEALYEIGPGAEKAVPTLIEVLKDRSEREQERRECAARILGSIGPKAAAAIPALLEASQDEGFVWRDKADESLKKINAGGAVRAGPGPERWAPIPHDGQVLALALSRDGKLLASATGLADKPVRLWDMGGH